MRETAKAMKDFFSGFGLPAYEEYSVPDDVELPYITYHLAEPEPFEKASMYAQVWFRTKSNAEILEVADAIVGAIGVGKILENRGGYTVLWNETPNIQILVDDDVRRAYINLSINSYNLPGV